MNSPGIVIPALRPNVRRGGGFSLRRSLEEQGVTLTASLREHLNFVETTVSINPRIDITAYRVGNDACIVPGYSG